MAGSRPTLAFTVLCCLVVISSLSWSVEAACKATDEVCEYWLLIEHRLTMMKGRQAVYAQSGQLYMWNDASASTPVDVDDVITADGWGESRLVVAVNNSIPAPTIEVWLNQTVVVHVTNHLASSDATIHWHGLHQAGTPWMDGVAFITQCPIQPRQTFTYRFKAYPSGTFWYHSHIGSQLTMGVVGAFIIHNPQDMPHPEHILMVQEWNHQYDSEYVTAQMEFGAFRHRKRIQTTKSIEGTRFSLFPFHTGLINGRGRFYTSSDNTTEAPLTTYSVTQGQTYRFRMIGSGSLYPFIVAIDGHPLTVIATDGYDVVPTVVDSIIINPGERYDFLVEANQTLGRYWVRAQTLEVNVLNHKGEAVLEYSGAPGPAGEATSSAKSCTNTDRCRVVNCPFKHYPADHFSDCIQLTDLDSKVQHEVPGAEPDTEVEDIFLNFAFPGSTWTPGSVNGRAFRHPPVSSLTQPRQLTASCDPEQCGEDKICACPYTLTLEHNKVYQFVMMNIGSGRGWAHPIHMHGHSYTVVKIGFPSYDPVTGQVGADSPDIDCRGKTTQFCNEAAWANSSWGGNSVPGLKMMSPPRKDTIMVPSGGYVVIRIKADNPGVWFMHCHIELHASNGMALVLNESFSRIPPPPVGFPVCGNFDFDNEEYAWPDEVTDDSDDDDDNDRISWRNFWIIVGCLSFVVLLQFLIIAIVCCKSRRNGQGDMGRSPETHFNPAFNEK